MYRVMDLCNLYDFYTFVFTLAFTPCTFNVLFYVRIKYYNNNNNKSERGLFAVINRNWHELLMYDR